MQGGGPAELLPLIPPGRGGFFKEVTLGSVCVTPKADMRRAVQQVRYVPKADMLRLA